MARPPKPLITQDLIGAAALALVDRTGNFTVPEIARRLGVQTASIYHHVDGRSGIVELLRVTVATGMDITVVEGLPWDMALTAHARRYRAAFAAHPLVVPMLATVPVRATSILTSYDRLVQLMEKAGFPLEAIMAALTAYECFILGAALDLAAPEEMWLLPEEMSTTRLAAALRAHPGSGSQRADRAFELGLSAMIEGFRVLRAQLADQAVMS